MSIAQGSPELHDGSLAYRQAKRRVTEFREEMDAVMEAHAAAMECRNCEAFLQLGIDAYHWLVRAESILRESIYQGLRADDADVTRALDALYATWSLPVEFAEHWIAKVVEAGYQPDNVKEFRAICEEVADVCEKRSWSAGAQQTRNGTTTDDDF